MLEVIPKIERTRKQRTKISSDLVCKKGNNETEIDLQEEQKVKYVESKSEFKRVGDD